MKIFKKEFSGNIVEWIIQLIKFGIVGISNTAISLVVYYIFMYLGAHYILANTMGFILGTINAYYWNNKYVFKKKKNEERSLVKVGTKVFISYGFTFLLSTVLLYLLVDIGGISKLVAPIINLVITIPINFLLNKLWAFKIKK